MAAKRILLPHVALTALAEADDPGAILIEIPSSKDKTASYQYHVVPKLRHVSMAHRRDGKPSEVQHQLKLFPLVLGGDGVTWAEANLWLLAQASHSLAASMQSYASNADDLAAFRRFLDETELDWLDFPANKLNRPTYRYNAHLKHLVANNEIAQSTARRRMSTVIRFYRWLVSELMFNPAHEPWKETDRVIEFRDAKGFAAKKTVATTDISIKRSISDDPYDGHIDDGGKLRPLSQMEQGWLLDALLAAQNTEMTLIHLFGLLTGARIQTILTFRTRHVLIERHSADQGVLRFPVGSGTGIDTKNDKRLVLHLPVWFYQMLRTYALSERARKRRQKAPGGDTENQYLFLSNRGSPFYSSKQDAVAPNWLENRRHAKSGQAVRQFIAETLIPHIRDKYSVPSFHFQFHDTRASFGMNLMDQQLALVAKGEISLAEAMNFVKARMGHASLATTERYLTYRSRVKMIRAAQDGWEAALHALASRAMGETGPASSGAQHG